MLSVPEFPLRKIKLVRHGESRANTKELNPQDVGDHTIPLTDLGWQQARNAGEALGAEFLNDALVYRSPYLRTQQTSQGIFQGAGLVDANGDPLVRVYEDPALRELDAGYSDYDSQQPTREVHGWFYFRYENGESPADCCDRLARFMDSLARQAVKKDKTRAILVSHGITIRCFVMRFFHLNTKQYDSMANPHNCDIITIGPKSEMKNPVFTTSKWGVEGIRLRETGS
jgi:broad specificity phosphatase PhoE